MVFSQQKMLTLLGKHEQAACVLATEERMMYIKSCHNGFRSQGTG